MSSFIQCTFRYYARNVPLNNSTKALSVSLPGRENAVGTLFRDAQRSIAWLENLLPLSHYNIFATSRGILTRFSALPTTRPSTSVQTRWPFLLPEVTYHDDPYEALKGADAALVFTESEIFRTLNWERAKSLMARGLVVDGRNLYSPQKMRELGLEYYSFGRE